MKENIIVTDKVEISDEAIKEEPSLYMLRHTVSAVDLINSGYVKPPLITRSEEEMNKILWGFGCDTKRFRYEVLHGLHTLVDGTRVDGLHFACSERIDDEWCNTEFNGKKVASEDALIENAAIKHGRAHATDLKIMRRGGKM